MAGGSRWAVAVLCGVQFVDVLGVTSAITALPAMLAGVSAPPAATAVLATVYAMFFGGLLVLGARLGDRYGYRRVLLTGCAGFALVSLVGASAQEVVQLVVARGLQGAAAAISVPSALRLLLEAASEPDRRRGALAAWSATGAAAGALGLLVGGALTDLLGWRAVFWVNIPVGILLAAAVRLVIPRSDPGRERVRLDLAGAALATLALQRDLGVSAVGAGLTLLPFSLGVVAGSALTKPLGARLSVRRLAAAGLGGISAGNLLLVLTYGSIAGVVAGVSLAGVGLGVASVAGTAIGTDIADGLSGIASGVLNTGAQLGTAIGVAALLLLAAGIAGPGTGTAVAWAVASGTAGLTGLALVIRAGAGRPAVESNP